MWLIFCAFASPNTETLDRILNELADQDQFVGSVRVVDGDEILLDKSYGVHPEQSLYMIGSITKSFTAAAIYDLETQGLLSVDQPVTTYLPELEANFPNPPTLHQLIRHLGGNSEGDIPSPWAVGVEPDPFWSVVQSTITSINKPGKKYKYSNTGYLILTEVIRRTSGKEYEDYLAERFFVPLGMDDTGIFRDASFTTRLVPGHLITPWGSIESRTSFPRLLKSDGRSPMAGGAGALVSTPGDLITWAAAIRDGRILTEESRSRLLTPGKKDYAGGWVVDEKLIWHNGALSPLGYSSYLRWSPNDKVVVAVTAAIDVHGISPSMESWIESALEGHETKVDIQWTPHSVFATLSAWGVHWIAAAFACLVLGVSLMWSRMRKPTPWLLFLSISALSMMFGGVGLTSVYGGLATLVFGTASIAIWGRTLFRWEWKYLLAGLLAILPLGLAFAPYVLLWALDIVLSNPLAYVGS